MKPFLAKFVLLPLGVLAVVFAVANRQDVAVYLNPLARDEAGAAFQMPLFILLLLMVVLGVVMGGSVVWLKQGKWRKLAKEAQARVRDLEAETARLSEELAANHSWKALPSVDADKPAT